MDAEQTVCSQCVCWVVLSDDRPLYEGVFPYGIVPIRNLLPDLTWNHHTKKRVPVYWVDLRRLDESTLERMAWVMAEVNGSLAQDILAGLHRGMRVPLDATCVKFGLSANTIEQAGRRAEEIAQSGGSDGSTLVTVAHVQVEPCTGGSTRG